MMKEKLFLNSENKEDIGNPFDQSVGQSVSFFVNFHQECSFCDM